VLLPRELEDSFTPGVEADIGKGGALLGIKKSASKGSSTLCTAKHVGHSISNDVSMPQSTRSNSAAR
jgi:hypothetical protein